MISKRRFFILIMMMFVLLFMFQFTQVVKENGNTYDTNLYLQKKKILRRVNVRSAKKRFCLSEKKRENMEKLRRSGVSIPSAGW